MNNKIIEALEQYIKKYGWDYREGGIMYNLYEYDFFKDENLGLAGKARTMEEARRKAKKLAGEWCEDEMPVVVKLRNDIWAVKGDSDYGIVIKKIK